MMEGLEARQGWFELAVGLVAALALLAIDALWLLDYLDHGQITPGGRASSTFTGWTAGTLIAVQAAVGLVLFASSFRAILRKCQE